ncbi:MAG: tRNA (guanosine(37)-N1)-methyltransferase TrmD [Armatimonadota bacterium]
MRVDIITIFPEMVRSAASFSILGRAQEKGLLDFHAVDLRNYTTDRHRTTDDAPFGGGAGMVMKPEPIFAAVEHAVAQGPGRPRVVLTSPRGRKYNQLLAEELAREPHIVIICGRYEGVDERVCQQLVTDEISIGDYVLTGGELAALVILDSVVRLLPGALGDEESAVHESFSSGLLEHPHYTRPAEFRGMKVPEVLLTGDHQVVRRWQRKEALRVTWLRRPELLASAPLSVSDRALLEELRKELIPRS